MARAMELAEASGNPDAVGFAYTCCGTAQYLNGHFKEGADLLERGGEILRNRTTGVTFEIDSGDYFLAYSLAQLGAVRRLSQEASRRLHEAIQRGDVYATVNLSVGNANLLWLAEDDPLEARARIETAMDAWSKQGVHLEHFLALLALTNVDLYEGRGKEAYARVLAQWGPLRRSLFLATVQSLRIHAWHMRARSALATASGNREPALLRVTERDARAID